MSTASTRRVRANGRRRRRGGRRAGRRRAARATTGRTPRASSGSCRRTPSQTSRRRPSISTRERLHAAQHAGQGDGERGPLADAPLELLAGVDDLGVAAEAGGVEEAAARPTDADVHAASPCRRAPRRRRRRRSSSPRSRARWLSVPAGTATSGQVAVEGDDGRGVRACRRHRRRPRRRSRRRAARGSRRGRRPRPSSTTVAPGSASQQLLGRRPRQRRARTPGLTTMRTPVPSGRGRASGSGMRRGAIVGAVAGGDRPRRDEWRPPQRRRRPPMRGRDGRRQRQAARPRPPGGHSWAAPTTAPVAAGGDRPGPAPAGQAGAGGRRRRAQHGPQDRPPRLPPDPHCRRLYPLRHVFLGPGRCAHLVGVAELVAIMATYCADPEAPAEPRHGVS